MHAEIVAEKIILLQFISNKGESGESWSRKATGLKSQDHSRRVAEESSDAHGRLVRRVDPSVVCLFGSVSRSEFFSTNELAQMSTHTGRHGSTWEAEMVNARQESPIKAAQLSLRRGLKLAWTIIVLIPVWLLEVRVNSRRYCPVPSNHRIGKSSQTNRLHWSL